MSYKKFLDWNKLHKVRKGQGGGYLGLTHSLTEEQRDEYDYLILQGYSDSQAYNLLLRDAKLDTIDPKSSIPKETDLKTGDLGTIDNLSRLTTYDLQKAYDYYNGLKTHYRDYEREVDPVTGKKETLAERRDRVGDLRSAAIKEQTQLKGNKQFMEAVDAEADERSGVHNFMNKLSGVDFDNLPEGMDANTAGAMGFAGKAVTAGVQALDNLAMGDKNFGALSAAIDSAVHGVSGALMKSGNPIAMGVAGGLEAANFMTKAGGQNVQGFDVAGISGGYGNIGHMDSSASRDFGAMIGLGGLNQKSMDNKLQKRNEQALMALKAANITDQIEFEQEARMNSVDNVVQSNKMALAGGVDTSLLAARQGGKLVLRAQNGAKLEEVEVSDKPNIIPEGEMHKNKHDIDLDGITKKGIPVITVSDDSVETLEEIQQQEDSIVQHAEIEEAEIIFNKELTDYIEAVRKEWNETNDNLICLEAGKRLAKEIVENTDDNAEITDDVKSQYLKNGSKIHIKKSHEGLFTKYCKGKVTQECINKGKNSSNPAVRKRATFAENARHFKHDWGGLLGLDDGRLYTSEWYNKPKSNSEEDTTTDTDFPELILESTNPLTNQPSNPTDSRWDLLERALERYDQPSTGSTSTLTYSFLGTGPRGYRNNNPLNIRISNINWDGKVSNNTDRSFELFETIEYGYRAAGKLLLNYIKEGNNTISKILNKWAPSGDGNNPGSYANTVSKRTGISKDQVLDPNDLLTIIKIVQAMAFVENGVEPDLSQIQAGIGMLS